MNYQKENNPIYNCIRKNIKIPGNNLINQVKDLYSENYNTLMKETEEDTNKWKDISCLWTGRITESNLQIQCNPYQNTNGIFHRTGTNNSKICVDPEKIP